MIILFKNNRHQISKLKRGSTENSTSSNNQASKSQLALRPRMIRHSVEKNQKQSPKNNRILSHLQLWHKPIQISAITTSHSLLKTKMLQR